MKETAVRDFYRTWREQLPELAAGYLFDTNKVLFPTRYIFVRFKKFVERLLQDELDEFEKIVIMPGIRGAGKTTLLLQLLNIERFLKNTDTSLLQSLTKLGERFYLDVSKLALEGISLNEFFKFYENYRNIKFETLAEKHLILLDEVHYDDRWGLFLKNLFDRTKGHKNILVVATGSSALHLKMNPDLSRRVSIEEIYPMKFNEYLILRHGQYPISGLSDDLQEIIFNSPDARAVFQGLKAKSDEVDRFFAELPPDSEDDFFAVGNFPFSANLTNRVKALELIKNVLNSIIIKDIIGFARFKAQTVAKLNRLLYLIASSDIISYDSLRTTLKIERFETLDSLVEVLIMSGVLFKVPSLGKPFTSTRKTPKLLFTAPALRTAILDNIFRSNIEGKKLEDYFALIYNKDLKGRYKATIAYDIAEGGADFVLRLPNQKPVVIEIGFHKEDTTQVETTQKKVKGKYGIVFGSKKLQLTDESIVKVPLEYLLLI